MQRQHARIHHPATESMMVLVMAATPSTYVSLVIIGRLQAPEAVSMKKRSLAPHRLRPRLQLMEVTANTMHLFTCLHEYVHILDNLDFFRGRI